MATAAVDADCAKLEQKWHDRLLKIIPFLEARIGAAAFPLDATEANIRNNETSWENFIVDQMRTAFGEPAADFAFINSSTLQIDEYIAGDILFDDIGRTFGFSPYLRYMTMSGAEFRQVMEAGYRGARGQGYVPQVLGFRVGVDQSRADGSRIVSMQLPEDNQWRDIDSGRTCTVVVSDFLYRGNDGYQIPLDRPASKLGSELKYLVLDAILRAQASGRKIGVATDLINPRYVQRQNCWSGASSAS